MVVALILLSQFKYDKLMMTVNFVDLMIIDPDTSAFLFTIMPRLRGPVVVGVLVAIPLLATQAECGTSTTCWSASEKTALSAARRCLMTARRYGWSCTPS